MSLVTLGGAVFYGSAICLYYIPASGHVKRGCSSQPHSVRKQIIIRLTVLQKISQAANGYDPNLAGGRSIFS